MAKKLRILVVVRDLGVAFAVLEGVQELLRRGHEIDVLFDNNGAAKQAFETGDKRLVELLGRGTCVINYEACNHSLINADCVFVGMSVSGKGIEQGVVFTATEYGIPVIGFEDFPGNRNNPKNWVGTTEKLTAILSVMPTSFDAGHRVRVVGPPQLEPYRNFDGATCGTEARRKLGISGDAPVIVFSGSPELETPHELSRVLGALRMSPSIPDGAVFILVRHSREFMGDQVHEVELPEMLHDNAASYRQTLWCLREDGFQVFDNTLGAEKLPAEHFASIHPEFRPPEFASYQELLCATAGNGVFLTNFGTDGVLVAPYLASHGVCSIALLNPAFGGAILKREKGMETLPLPGILQARSERDLSDYLENVLRFPDMINRFAHLKMLKDIYPFPEESAAVAVANEVEKIVGT